MRKMNLTRPSFKQPTTEVVLFILIFIFAGCSTPEPNKGDEGHKDPPLPPPPINCKTMGEDVGFESKISLCEIDCDKGDAWGCKRLGGLWEKAGKMDKARRDYQRSCISEKKGSAGDNIGCQEFGKFIYLGLGGEKDTTKARQYFEKACDGGYGGGCFILALLYYTDDGNEERAKEYAIKAGSLKYNLRFYSNIDSWIEGPDPYMQNKYTEARITLAPVMNAAHPDIVNRRKPHVPQKKEQSPTPR